MSQQLLAVTVIGADRSGIVSGVTGALFEAGCNLEDVSSTILRGHFSMMLIVGAPQTIDAPTLESTLQTVATDLDLIISVRAVATASGVVAPATHMISVYGTDRPGIVYHATAALASKNINITDLTSRVIGEPDEPVYALMLEVAAPEQLDMDGLLEELQTDLAVDVSIHPIDVEVL